jgi:beta-glucanase (GH16 family)
MGRVVRGLRLGWTVKVALLVIMALPSIAGAQTLVWSDEFNGTQLDPSVWTYDVGGSGFGNAELEYYTARPENVKVSGGDLVITARRETYIDNTKVFTSGRIKTQGRVDVTYGGVEMRVKVPDLREGLWPAGWLLGSDIGSVPWPGCGEIDILEMGGAAARPLGLTNQRNSASVHWDYQGTQADATMAFDSPTGLNGAYHTYRMDWSPTAMIASIDGAAYWTFDLTNSAASLEEFQKPFFLIFNLAVGGNYVGLATQDLITAPLPAEMHVDYVRVYNTGSTQVTHPSNAQQTGNFGIFTETTPTGGHLTYGTDAQFYLWNNMTPAVAPPAPEEGTQVWSWDIGAANWWGAGSLATPHDFNLAGHAEGKLHVNVKTTTNETVGFGIASSAAGEGWVDLAAGGPQYGLVRDGAWHEVVIPSVLFGNVDFQTATQPFMIRGAAPAAAFNISVDNVWWEPSSGNHPTPANGDFAVYSETAARVATFTMPTDGQFFIWSGTLTPTTTVAYEGSQALSYTSAAGLTWFGAAFSPTSTRYNLSAYRYTNSRLHAALKTSSTAIFYVGMKSGSPNDIGQRWIKFAPGADPYGFVRDGNWHAIDIPMSDITPYVDLTDVSQLFEILGVDGAISDIAIDDVRFTGGGAPLGSTPTPTATSTVRATATVTPTATATATPTATLRPTATATNTQTPTATLRPTATSTSTSTATGTASATRTNTPTATATATNRPTPTATTSGSTVVTLPYSLIAAYTDGTTFASTGGADGVGSAYSSTLLGSSVSWSGASFNFGPANQNNAVRNTTVTLPTGQYQTLLLLGMGVNGDQVSQTVKVNYADGSSGTFTQTFSNWLAASQNVTGQAVAKSMAYRNKSTGVKDNRTFNLYGYTFALTGNKTVSSVVLPANNNVVVVGASLLPSLVVTPTATPTSTVRPTATSTSTATSTATTVRATATPTSTATATSTARPTATSTATATVTPTTGTATLLSQGHPATSSSVEPTFTASAAVDGDTGTRWSSAFSDPQWIYVDLGAAHPISRVVLNWEAAYGTAYQLQSSNDAVNWSTFYTTTTGDGGIDDLAVVANGRYIRMNGTARATMYGYSLWELQVYGQ